MAQFSPSDINDAKRRVEEMRRRAHNFVDDKEEIKYETQNIKEEKPKQSNEGKTEPAESEEKDNSSNSFALILAIILILAHEDADNMLILALLYILL